MHLEKHFSFHTTSVVSQTCFHFEMDFQGCLLLMTLFINLHYSVCVCVCGGAAGVCYMLLIILDFELEAKI